MERKEICTYDFSDPAATGARIDFGDSTSVSEAKFIWFGGDTLLRIDGTSDAGYPSYTPYNLRSGERGEPVTLSEPLIHEDFSGVRICGEIVVIPSDDTLTIRRVDLRTGEVRSVHLGLCERQLDVRVSADGRRVVAFRPRPDRRHPGDFVIYNL